MSYTHLSIIERSKLEILHQQGKSARAIAKDSRELCRNAAQETYRAGPSQESYVQRRQASIPAGKWTPELLDWHDRLTGLSSIPHIHMYTKEKTYMKQKHLPVSQKLRKAKSMEVKK